MVPAPAQFASPWPHRLAVLVAAATFPLVWVGGLVTTYDAGMAVPDWPTTYGYNLFLYPWQTWIWGPWDLFIEHGHRLLAALVGLLTIALALALARHDRRRWMRWLGVAALAVVVFEGVVGGLRVHLDERQLAQVHGCVGPAFFALATALAVCTSHGWPSDARPRVPSRTGQCTWLAMATTALAYLQLVLGSRIRHAPPEWDAAAFQGAVWAHLVVAGVLAAQVFLLAAFARRRRRDEPALVRPAQALAWLLVLQLALGFGAWIVNHGWPSWFDNWAWAERYVVVREGRAQAMVTTAHVALGSLILATALVLALRSLGQLGRRPAVRPRTVEAAA